MILSCKNLSKSFGAQEILKNVSFLLEAKEKAGIVGVNGAGKTTVFKILTGELAADGGEAVIPKDVKTGYLSQMTNSLSLKNTVYEELLSVFEDLIQMEEEIRAIEAGMAELSGDSLSSSMEKYSRLSHDFEDRGGYAYKSHIRGVLKGLNFGEDYFDKELSLLSGGEKTRAALGKLLLDAPDILLLDEPTNHLDIESVEWLEGFLKSYSGAILLISHDRYFLDRICTKIIEIENKISVTYNGNYSSYARKKEADREIKLRHYLNQQKEIKHQEEVIKTLRSFNREKSIKRAESREKMLKKIEVLERPEDAPDKMRLLIEPRRTSGNDVLSVSFLSKSFDTNDLFKNISFEVKRGDRAALIGPNGVGKTTLLRILLDLLPSDGGCLRFGTGVEIGYYDQEHQDLNPANTIIEEISDAYPFLTLGEIRNTLAAFVFTGDDVFKPISALSGGERGRVALAKIMLSNANFLILDEPTNHLDIFSKEILEEALRSYTGTVLYISHDRYFVNNTATRIFELLPAGLAVYEGNYDYYAEKRREADTSAPESGIDDKSSQNKEDWLRKKEEQAEERRRKGLLERTEKEIEQTEKKIQELDELLALEEVYTNHEKSAAAFEEKAAAEKRLEDLYEVWGELSE